MESDKTHQKEMREYHYRRGARGDGRSQERELFWLLRAYPRHSARDRLFGGSRELRRDYEQFRDEGSRTRCWRHQHSRFTCHWHHWCPDVRDQRHLSTLHQVKRVAVWVSCSIEGTWSFHCWKQEAWHHFSSPEDRGHPWIYSKTLN